MPKLAMKSYHIIDRRWTYTREPSWYSFPLRSPIRLRLPRTRTIPNIHIYGPLMTDGLQFASLRVSSDVTSRSPQLCVCDVSSSMILRRASVLRTVMCYDSCTRLSGRRVSSYSKFHFASIYFGTRLWISLVIYRIRNFATIPDAPIVRRCLISDGLRNLL